MATGAEPQSLLFLALTPTLTLALTLALAPTLTLALALALTLTRSGAAVLARRVGPIQRRLAV